MRVAGMRNRDRQNGAVDQPGGSRRTVVAELCHAMAGALHCLAQCNTAGITGGHGAKAGASAGERAGGFWLW